MSKEQIIQIIDCLLIFFWGAVIYFLLRSAFRMVRQRHLFMSGQLVTRKEHPEVFWLIIASFLWLCGVAGWKIANIVLDLMEL